MNRKNIVFVVQYTRRVSWHDFLRGEDGWESKLQSLIQELKRLGRPEKRTCLRAMVLGTSRWESNRNGAWFLEFLQFMILIPKIVQIGTFAWDIWKMKGLSNPMEPFGNIIINTLGEIPWTGWYLQKLQVSIVNLLENHLSQSWWYGWFSSKPWTKLLDNRSSRDRMGWNICRTQYQYHHSSGLFERREH